MSAFINKNFYLSEGKLGHPNPTPLTMSTEEGEGSLFTCPLDVSEGEGSLFISRVLTTGRLPSSLWHWPLVYKFPPPNDLPVTVKYQNTVSGAALKDKCISMRTTWYEHLYTLHFMSLTLPGVKLDAAQRMHLVSVHYGT